jgi:hypothetical protein
MTQRPRESSEDRWGSRSGFEFLENVEVEERNDELNEKVREGRKRKINQDEEGLAKKRECWMGCQGRRDRAKMCGVNQGGRGR